MAQTNETLQETLTNLLTTVKTTLTELLKDNPVLQGSAVTTWLISLACVLVTLAFVVLFVAFGWWIVWTCFLSRFKFVRELLGNAPQTPQETPSTELTPENNPKKRRRRHHIQ